MSKVELRFFTIADFEEEEVWLRQQHRKGLRLRRTIAPCFYIFEECAPEDVVYRLDYKNNTETGEYLRLCQDYGWEYFNRFLGWLYFRKSASQVVEENDGELFSDNASRVEMLRHILRTRMLPIAIFFPCCVLPNWSRAIAGGMGGFLSGFFTVLLVVYVYLLFYCGLKLRRLRKKYEE